MQNLQQRLEAKTRDYNDEMRNYSDQTRQYNRVASVLSLLTNGTDQQAAETLARIRLGDRLDDIVASPSAAEQSLLR